MVIRDKIELCNAQSVRQRVIRTKMGSRMLAASDIAAKNVMLATHPKRRKKAAGKKSQADTYPKWNLYERGNVMQRSC